ncbi:uncharacterized protein [Bemisia tabaci]|uniref:uncharacterized protein isoform X3 n=1 Tax=Bemisia tabaci TaxID=7038 RepID=UPI003B28D40A
MSSSSEGQQISEICRNNEAYRKSAIKAADCDHKDSLKVIEEFQEVYRKRMKLLNEASDKSPELSELKIRTLQDWVEDLTEQNSLLATTLEELEAEALVKANSLSHTTSDFSRTRNSFHDSLVSNRTVDLQDSALSQSFLGISLDDLQRLRMENEELKQKYSKKEAGFEKYRLCMEKLLERVEQPLYDSSHPAIMFSSGDNSRIITKSHSFELEHLNSMIEDYKNQIKLLKEELSRKENDVNNLKSNLEEKDESLAKMSEQLAYLQEIVQEVELLKTEMEKNRKNFHETRMSLAMEVASKHDQNLKLKHEIQLLEEQVRQSEMSTHFKDDIIKELRKELKTARCKEKNDECLSQLQYKIDSLSMQLKAKNDLISQLEMKLRLEKNTANSPKVIDDDKVEELKLKLKEKDDRIRELEAGYSEVFSISDTPLTSVFNNQHSPKFMKNKVNEISSSLFFEKFEDYYKLSEEESIIFVNLFKESEAATKISQERESKVLALDEQLLIMSRLLHEILQLFGKIEESNLLDDVNSENSSVTEMTNQDLHHSVKLIQENLNSVLSSLNGQDFSCTNNCNHLLSNVEKVFEEVQSELFLLKEGYSSHKNQTEIVYETYRSIQKSLKAFIEHITEVSKSFEELKNMDLNGILSIHQDKILSLKHDLQETRKKKEETLKIVKKYLTKEDTSNLGENNLVVRNLNHLTVLANESYNGCVNVLQDISSILRNHSSFNEDVSIPSIYVDTPQTKEKIFSTLDHVLSTNQKMKSILENASTSSSNPVPPNKSWNSSHKEHGDQSSHSTEMVTSKDQSTSTDNEMENSERRLSELSIELEHTKSLLRNSEQDMNSRLQDFENYKSCAEKMIDDLKLQVSHLKKTQDLSAVTKLESKISALEKEKDAFIKTVECQNKELSRIKQLFTIAQEEKNAALIEKSIAQDELNEKAYFVNEKLNAKDMRIKELSSMLDQSQQSVTKLQKEIETLNSKSDYVMEKLRKDLCELTVTLKERDNLLSKREECIDALHETIRLLETENKDLRKEIDNLVKQKEKYIEFEEKLLDAQDKIMLLETEKHSLAQRVKAFKSYFETLHGNLTACIEQVAEEKKRVERLQETNINTTIKVYELEQDYQMSERKLQCCQEEIKILEAKVKELEDSLSSSNEAASNLRCSLEEKENDLVTAQNINRMYEENIESLRKENESIDSQNEETKIKLRYLSEEVNTLKRQNEDLSLKNSLALNDINQENQINEMLRQRIEEIKKSRNQDLAAAQENEAMLKDTQKKLSEIMKANSILENNFVILLKELNNIQLQDEPSILSKINKEGNGINRTKIVIEQLKLVEKSYHNFVQQANDYRQQLKSKQNEIVILTEMNENMKSKYAKKIDEMSKQFQQLKNSNESYRDETTKLKGNISNLTSQLNEALNREESAKSCLLVKDSGWSKKLHDNEQEVVQLRGLLSNLKRDFSKRSAELAQEQANHAATETRLKSVSADVMRLRKELRSKEEIVTKVQGGMSQLTNKLVSYFQEITEKAELVSLLEAENKRLRNELGSQTYNHNEVNIQPKKRSGAVSFDVEGASGENPNYLCRLDGKLKENQKIREPFLSELYQHSLINNPLRESPCNSSASSSKYLPPHRQKSNLTQKYKSMKQQNAQLLKDKEVLERINDQLISEMTASDTSVRLAFSSALSLPALCRGNAEKDAISVLMDSNEIFEESDSNILEMKPNNLHFLPDDKVTTSK